MPSCPGCHGHRSVSAVVGHSMDAGVDALMMFVFIVLCLSEYIPFVNS